MKCETGMFYTFWTAAEKQTSPFQRSESELASNPDRQIKSEFPHSVVKSSRQRPLITVLHDFCRIVSINQLLPDHRPWHLLHRILCKKYCSVCVCVWDRKCPSRCTVFKAKWWSVFFHKKKQKKQETPQISLIVHCRTLKLNLLTCRAPEPSSLPLVPRLWLTLLNQSVLHCEAKNKHDTWNCLKPHNKTHNKTAATRAGDYTGRAVFKEKGLSQTAPILHPYLQMIAHG